MGHHPGPGSLHTREAAFRRTSPGGFACLEFEVGSDLLPIRRPINASTGASLWRAVGRWTFSLSRPNDSTSGYISSLTGSVAFLQVRSVRAPLTLGLLIADGRRTLGDSTASGSTTNSKHLNACRPSDRSSCSRALSVRLPSAGRPPTTAEVCRPRRRCGRSCRCSWRARSRPWPSTPAGARPRWWAGARRRR